MAEEVKVEEVKTRKRTTKKVAEEVVTEVAEAPAKKTTRKTAVKAEKTDAEKVEKKPTAKKTATKKTPKASVQEFLGTGKRKTSVARVRLTTGTGVITVNGKDVKDYFKLESLIGIVKQPLVLTELDTMIDVKANIYGGGISGQAGALRHGITKALIEFKPELRTVLKKAGFITRDSRKKERKKYGLKKARKAPQFSKR